MEEKREKLLKSERLDSKKANRDAFWQVGNSSFPGLILSEFVLYARFDSSLSKDYASILISVPKKKFKRAVKEKPYKKTDQRGNEQERISIFL